MRRLVRVGFAHGFTCFLEAIVAALGGLLRLRGGLRWLVAHIGRHEVLRCFTVFVTRARGRRRRAAAATALKGRDSRGASPRVGRRSAAVPALVRFSWFAPRLSARWLAGLPLDVDVAAPWRELAKLLFTVSKMAFFTKLLSHSVKFVNLPVLKILPCTGPSP